MDYTAELEPIHNEFDYPYSGNINFYHNGFMFASYNQDFCYVKENQVRHLINSMSGLNKDNDIKTGGHNGFDEIAVANGLVTFQTAYEANSTSLILPVNESLIKVYENVLIHVENLLKNKFSNN